MVNSIITFLMQRRTTTESLEGIAGEPLAEGSTGITTEMGGEDELAVEGIIEGSQQANSTSDFITDSGQPVGLHIAIARCIERYGILLLLIYFYLAV